MADEGGSFAGLVRSGGGGGGGAWFGRVVGAETCGEKDEGDGGDGDEGDGDPAEGAPAGLEGGGLLEAADAAGNDDGVGVEQVLFHVARRGVAIAGLALHGVEDDL